MPTFLQEKNAVANILGKTDGTTPVVIRDNAINDVRQNEIANYYPFSWLRGSNTVTTDASGQADLPTDFNPTHKPKDVRIESTGQGGDNVFTQCNIEEFDLLNADQFRYFIDYNSDTNLWRINTHNPSESIRIVYYKIPSTLVNDTDIDMIPDLKVIAYLAASTYWLSSERDETNSDRFRALGEARLQNLVIRDKRSQPQRLTRLNPYDLGYNRAD